MKKITKKMPIMLMTIAIIVGTVLYSICNNNKFRPIKEDNNGTLAMYVENEEGEYFISSDSKFPTEGYELNLEKSTCINGGTLSQNGETKMINATISNNDKCTLYFDREIFNAIEASAAVINGQIPKGTNGERTDFAEPATTDEGVFEMADDYGKSYYYRGAVENNYVKFAGFYWRIIRVNGDGSIRIMYDGTMAHANGENSTDRVTHLEQVFNTNSHDAKYVGWMYEPADTENGAMIASTSKAQAQTNTVSSEIKIIVDEWYKTNILDKGYGSAISDTLFCNDRSTPGQSSTGWSSDTGLGYGRNATAYGTIARYGWGDTAGYDNPKPQFTCPQKNDAFTVNDTNKGNGALTYPVGLITGDEILAAGSGRYYMANSSYYLYKGSWYWSLSPNALNQNGYAGTINVRDNGGLAGLIVPGKSSAVPVINLNADYVKNMVGTGIMTDPYRATDVTP